MHPTSEVSGLNINAVSNSTLNVEGILVVLLALAVFTQENTKKNQKHLCVIIGTFFPASEKSAKKKKQKTLLSLLTSSHVNARPHTTSNSTSAIEAVLIKLILNGKNANKANSAI